MVEVLGDVVTVIVALYLYDKYKTWREWRRYR